MDGRKRNPSSKANGCPPLCGRPQKRLQEARRKRLCQRGGTISYMVIAPVEDDVEPMEVDPREDEKEPTEVDPPPGWLPWHHNIVPGLPSTPPSMWCCRIIRPVPYLRPCLRSWH
ncbi:hypothetical protein GRJ2_001281100 [Grus japonensis]|uniref:Uncharacterized protein n=1 Tax=Grus japonensis TaxID=30415 RepID=A0ABC9WRT5_GRUJA